MNSHKAQTTIEYLLLISVVVLIFAGVLITVNQLKGETEKPVNITGKEETPVGALGTQLENLRQIGSPTGEAPAQQLAIAFEPELVCAYESIVVTVTGANGPAEGVTVKLNSETATMDTKTTGADGKVTFTPQAMGAYTVSAEKQDSAPASKQLSVC